MILRSFEAFGKFIFWEVSEDAADTDASEIRNKHLGFIVHPYEYWDIYYINWWTQDFKTINSTKAVIDYCK